MVKKKKRRARRDTVKRASFPSDEGKLSWLSSLLDAYFVVDRGVAGAVESEERKGRMLSCDKGCSVCCRTNSDIPVYPLELMGLSWYAAEKSDGGRRKALMERLESHTTGNPCPFLIDRECAVYALRPMACRQFAVFGTRCAEGEDPYYSRRDDLLKPVRRYLDQAFFIMLSFHGLEKQSEKIRAVENGAMNRMVKNLQTCNWKILAWRMMKIDEERAGAATLKLPERFPLQT